MLSLAWLVVLILNGVRLMQVMRLEPSEAPKTGAWVAWGLSVAGMFMSGCMALVAWVVIEWVLPPVDPFEDTLGTVQLYTRARGNISFMIISTIVAGVVVALTMSGAMQ